jgi:peptide-methionine (S)-S-oxide reductase
MTEIATLAGGCFWCLEAVFQRLRGVQAVKSGYTGGDLAAPSYQQVCSGDTGHAEAVQIEFDSVQISYAQLLDVFFATHNPTTLNRQGHDVGTQYRSAIFVHSAEQEALAQQALLRAQQDWPMPIVTTIAPMSTFWPAEIEHDNYYNLHPAQPYCMAVVGPKVSKMMHSFSHLLNE